MKNILKIGFIILLVMSPLGKNYSLAQEIKFDHQDSLRYLITPERSWWDLKYYHLDVQVFPDEQSISGVNTIQYEVLEPYNRMQIDLMPPMQIDKVLQEGKQLEVIHDENAHFILLDKPQKKGQVDSVEVYFSGKPPVSENPPWTSGWTWKKDSLGNHFIANANQGSGPRIWWPNKDHMYDEVDSMSISARVPDGLIAVSNGRLKSEEKHRDGTRSYHWFISNPINSYGVNINVADYAHFADTLIGEKGRLDIDYYVLPENLEEAKEQFGQVKPTIKAFEHWFGPYPFYKDGFKLVQVPYLGMEHQSSVTYGNNFQNGFLGEDLTRTGWGLKFDYIIIHESAHEWFANNVTHYTKGDLWLHESFATYAESIFLEYHYGKYAGAEYLQGARSMINNKSPIMVAYEDIFLPGGDIYPKGANVLHTLRQLIDDDVLWRDVLRGINQTFYHQTVKSKEVEQFISEVSGKDLDSFFEQYLRTTMIPILEYRFLEKKLMYRWTQVVDNFNMPVQVTLNGKEQWLNPNVEWQELETEGIGTTLIIDPEFYVTAFDLTVKSSAEGKKAF